jgi:hypothetical protein
MLVFQIKAIGILFLYRTELYVCTTWTICYLSVLDFGESPLW